MIVPPARSIEGLMAEACWLSDLSRWAQGLYLAFYGTLLLGIVVAVGVTIGS